MNPIERHPPASPARQSGMALIVGLLLLVVVTLIGLAGIRGTLTQQIMSANFYDRETAMQNAEAEVKTIQANWQNTLSTNAAKIRNCSTAAAACTSNPFDDPNLNAFLIDPGVSGANALAAGTPQFVIDNMGQWVNPSSNTGFNQTAGAHQYGAQGLSAMATYYRITVRSGNPSTVGNRAVVTVQVLVR